MQRESQFYLPKKIKPFKRKHCPVRTNSILDLPPQDFKKRKEKKRKNINLIH
jgi:hypothetical protein